MYELITKETDHSVIEFIENANPKRRDDAYRLLDIFTETSGYPAKMWGPSIIGFGEYHYKYASGREGDNMVVGFSPRSQALTFYNMNVIEPDEELRAKLGKHTFGKGCLYIKKLADVDLPTFKQVIERSVKHIQAEYGK